MALARWFFQLLWIGVCAVAMLWQTKLLLHMPQPIGWLCAFVFSATVFGYNFTAPPLRRWPAWAFGLIGGFCFFKLTVLQQITVLLPAVIWLLYYDRARPGLSTGLRQYPALKPLAIALAWAGVTVLLPLATELWLDAGLLFVGRAAFIYALALAYDLCDQPADLEHGLSTLVLQLGAQRSFRLIDVMLLLTASSAVLHVVFGDFAWHTAFAQIISLLISAVAIRYVTQKTAWLGWRKVLIDGLMVLQFILVWISLKT